jgi:hypothetical protein
VREKEIMAVGVLLADWKMAEKKEMAAGVMLAS